MADTAPSTIHPIPPERGPQVVSVATDAGTAVATLPDQPGVYLFRDAGGQILYVGKALSLRKRVGSYFHGPLRLAPRIRQLVKAVDSVEVRITPSEAEALLLESELIKSERPKYNVAFRDDKSYPFLKLTGGPYPRLMVARKTKKMLPQDESGARYFGPYADAGMLHEALRFLRRVFPLRTCRAMPDSPCLEYHIGQCLAPCVGRIDEPAYQQIVRDLVEFLEGKRDRLLNELTRRMDEAARSRRYEVAARYRDQIAALTSIIVAKEKSAQAGPLEQLQLALKLPTLPRRIEAFDISNIQGQFAVGSMVTFQDGKPFKSHYRKFKIKTVGISAPEGVDAPGGSASRLLPIRGGDDFKMMQEVVRRRYSGSLSEELPAPDLILVDGGKGQLGAAVEVLTELGITTPILGLAKQHEEIFVPGRSTPIRLLATSPVLHLIQHLRDEAHRFAVTYHRRVRGKQVEASALDEIPGIGPKRKAALLSTFGSLERIAQADPEEIAKIAHISHSQVQALLRRLPNSRSRHGHQDRPEADRV